MTLSKVKQWDILHLCRHSCEISRTTKSNSKKATNALRITCIHNSLNLAYLVEFVFGLLVVEVEFASDKFEEDVGRVANVCSFMRRRIQHAAF